MINIHKRLARAFVFGGGVVAFFAGGMVAAPTASAVPSECPRSVAHPVGDAALCLFNEKAFEGRMLKFRDCGCQNLGPTWGFDNRAESYINAYAAFTDLRARCRRLHARRDIKLIAVDALHELNYGTAGSAPATRRSPRSPAAPNSWPKSCRSRSSPSPPSTATPNYATTESPCSATYVTPAPWRATRMSSSSSTVDAHDRDAPRRRGRHDRGETPRRSHRHHHRRLPGPLRPRALSGCPLSIQL